VTAIPAAQRATDFDKNGVGRNGVFMWFLSKIFVG
jgi:hypothetical protein